MRDPFAPQAVIGQWRRLAARENAIFLAGPVAELRWRGYSRAELQLGAKEMSAKCLGRDRPAPQTDFGMVRSRFA